jgi:hypothetical protein
MVNNITEIVYENCTTTCHVSGQGLKKADGTHIQVLIGFFVLIDIIFHDNFNGSGSSEETDIFLCLGTVLKQFDQPL